MEARWDEGSKLQEIPDEYLCPITQELMTDPVVTADGHTYERKAIEEWLKSHKTSPLTNKLLEHRTLKPNYSLKATIEKFKENLPRIQIRNLTDEDFRYAVKLREEEMISFTVNKNNQLEQAKISNIEKNVKLNQLIERINLLELNTSEEKHKNIKLENENKELREALKAAHLQLEQKTSALIDSKKTRSVGNYNKSKDELNQRSHKNKMTSVNPNFFNNNPNYKTLVKQNLTEFPHLNGKSYKDYYEQHKNLLTLVSNKNATIRIIDYDLEGDEIWQKCILVEAAERGLEKLVEKIIKAGVNVNKSNSYAEETYCEEADAFDGGGSGYRNETSIIRYDIYPLHQAIKNKHRECVKVLLHYGAKPYLRDESGKTAFELAESNEMRDILKENMNSKKNLHF